MSRPAPALVEAVVGIPLYENLVHLRPAIESLLAQDHPSFAIVVADDSSSDEPGEIVRGYQRADGRLFYLRNPVRLGLVGNWRRAFALARERFPAARYFAWASDHDLWEPSWLSTLAAELDANPGAVLAYPLNDVIGVSGERLSGPWRFDTRGEARPVRFVRVLRRMVAGDMVYGLARVQALERCDPLRDVVLPDRLLLAELSLQGEFRQVNELLWHRRRLGPAAARPADRLFAGRRPRSAALPWWLAHARALAIGRPAGPAAAAAYLGLAPLLGATRRAYYAAGGRGRASHARRRTATRIVVDALQVGGEPTGVGRLAILIGEELRDLPAVEVELRCTVEALPLLAPAFPPTTRVRTPLRASTPRWRRILYQLVVAPLRDSRALLVCPGDQGPLWGRAPVLLSLNDVRRLARPDTCGRVEASFYRFLVPRAARHATAVVTISEFSRLEIERLLGVPAEVVALHPAPRPHPVAGGDHLLVVGALRRYKAPETVIEAVALLDPAERRTVLFAGPDEGRAGELRLLAARRGVAESVRILGWVGEPELEELYSGTFATICPSTYEGYDLPVAESLSRGLPTVASDIPPHREVADEAAVYFPPGDAASLASILRRLDAEPALHAELGRRGHERSRDLAVRGRRWRATVTDLLERSAAL